MSGGNVLELESCIREDYEISRKNIIDAEKCDGRSPEAEKLIELANKKFSELEEAVLSYEQSRSPEELMHAAGMARELRLLSSDALEKAREVSLSLGIRLTLALAVFTLTGALLYLYLIKRGFSHWTFHATFWSFFGVMTNLTYSSARHVMNRCFSRLHLGWYISKIIQAPLITLALLFLIMGISLGLESGTSVEFRAILTGQESDPTYVLYGTSFILGLFSRRTWEYLELFKDRLLPKPA